MSDGPLILLLIVITCTIGATCGFVAGNAAELERGVDVPERVEAD